MSYDPDSPTDLAQDLPRAAQYGMWAAKFSNSSPPDGLSEFGAWGHIARWLAQKAAADITLRATGVTGPDLLVNALVREPSYQLGWPAYLYNSGMWAGPRNPLAGNARGNQRTLRGMLLWGVNRSDDKAPQTWTSSGQRLVQALASAIETDPDPAVRLEALRLVMQGSFPVKAWSATLLPAIDRAQALLAETTFDTTTRRALQGLLSDAKSRLLALLAQLASLPPLPGGDALAPAERLVNWPLVAGIAVGVIAAGLGVVAYRRRGSASGARRRLAP